MNTTKFAASLAIGLALMLPAPEARAQTDTSKTSVDDLYIDFPIPDITAFSLLGVNPSNIARPASVKEFSAALLNAAGLTGSITSGVAVEWAPFQTIGKLSSGSVEAYRNEYGLRSLQITLATARAGTATRAAVGLKWTPVDLASSAHDERLERAVLAEFRSFSQSSSPAVRRSAMSRKLDLTARSLGLNDTQTDAVSDAFFAPNAGARRDSALRARVKAVLAAPASGLTQQQAATIELLAEELIALEAGNEAAIAGLGQRIGTIKESYLDSSWNKTALQIAGGITALAPNSTWQELSADRFAGYAGASLAIGDWGQVLAQVGAGGSMQTAPVFRQDSSASIRDSASVVANSPFERTSWSLGGRVVLGGANVHGTLEAAYSSSSFEASLLDTAANTTRAFTSNANSIRLTIGVEVKLADGAWLELAVGSDSRNNPAGRPVILALGNIKYAFAKEPRYAIP